MPAARRSRKPARARARAPLFSLRAANTWRQAEEPPPLTVPTAWVKLIFAIFLLPVCWVSTEAFCASFGVATLDQQFWATEEFWFFTLGGVLWLIAFYGLPRPVLIYVFGHELTHALWVWMMGGRVSKFKVGRDGGHVVTDTNNFWIALAPYFFPIYSIAVILLYGVAALFVDVMVYRKLMLALLGVTWAFHMTFTCWMISRGQTDLTEHGTFFSLVLIYLMNLAILTALLVLAAPYISWQLYRDEWIYRAAELSAWVVSLLPL